MTALRLCAGCNHPLTRTQKRFCSPVCSARATTQPRIFPLAPLLEATGLTPTGLADKVGAGGTAMRRAAAEGLTVSEADRWAIRCGRHPAEIWPGLWADLHLDQVLDLLAAALRHDLPVTAVHMAAAETWPERTAEIIQLAAPAGRREAA